MEYDFRVVKCDDGVYRWLYDLDFRKNPSVLYTVIFAVTLCYLLPLVILAVIFAIDGMFLQAMQDILPIYLLCGLALVVITACCYVGIGIYYKWTFSFMYEMDEEGIMFRRIGSDAEKTEAIGNLGMLTGMMTGNIGLIGSGMNMSLNQGSYSRFSKVYTVKACPERDLIKVNSFFLFNQVYVNPDDYGFVLEYIETRTGKTG